VSRDLARDRHLTLAGWTVLYFSWDEVMFHPEMVRSQTEEALERAHPQLEFS
jgi:very-short-patch-repair endonuclease